MTFDDILAILDSKKTHYQIAADLHAMLQTKPSDVVKPIKERQKRQARTPKATSVTTGEPEVFSNGLDSH